MDEKLLAELKQNLLRALEAVGANEDKAKVAELEAVAKRYRNVLADYYADTEQRALYDCQAWQVAQGKRPYVGSLPNAAVFDAATVSESILDPESNYPHQLFAHLKGGKPVANHRSYPTLAECEADVEAAWLACVAEKVDPTDNTAPEGAKKAK